MKASGVADKKPGGARDDQLFCPRCRREVGVEDGVEDGKAARTAVSRQRSARKKGVKKGRAVRRALICKNPFNHILL